jgi:chromosome segregation ATPase
VEYDKMRSGADSSTPNILDSSQDVAQSTISIEGIGHSCANMAEAKSIITELEKERFALEKEVNGLRVDFERVQGELITLKKSSKVVNQQTIALRGDLNKAKTLLSEAETIKIQLESDLEKSQQQIQQIQRSSSESYNAIVQQSQREISMLKIELESKDEAIEQLQALSKEHISKFDITSVSMQCSQQPSVVTSSERFKVEKGQSMFGILKGKRTMRKSKDQLSYRQK